VAQSRAVIEVLQALVEFFVQHPGAMPADFLKSEANPVRSAVAYVGGMTDRFAFDTAVTLLDWDPSRLPRGIGRDA
jgi:dGTPase